MQFGFFSPNTVLPYIARDIVSVSTCETDRWDEMGWDGMRWDAMGCDGMRWDAMG